MLRQVELVGRRPVAVPALGESVEALGAGRVEAYEGRCGRVAESPVGAWDEGFPHTDLSLDEYDDVWRAARQFLDDDQAQRELER